MVCGQYVPEEVLVGVPQYAANHCEVNFKNPENFIPERWLGAPEYEDDDRKARQPFSHGPRNCIGKNLAYAEMRLLLASILWNFDLQLAEESEKWLEENKIYTLWMKAPLMTRLRKRQD